MTAPKETWWWARHEDSESWEGPFKTRELAEADARVTVAEEGDCGQQPIPIVAQASMPDAGVCAVWSCYAHDLESFLERMEEYAADEAFFAGDDPLFEAKDGAEAALQKAIRDWAESYLTVMTWTVRADEAQPVRAATVPEGEGGA